MYFIRDVFMCFLKVGGPNRKVLTNKTKLMELEDLKPFLGNKDQSAQVRHDASGDIGEPMVILFYNHLVRLRTFICFYC